MNKQVKSGTPAQTSQSAGQFNKFLFKAHAVAFRGSVRKPYYQELGRHAALSTYAGAAGHSTARSEGFALQKDIAYDVATSEITADRSKTIHRTVVQSTLENVRVAGGRLTIDKMVARLESVYDASSYPGQKAARVLPAGSEFGDIRMDGKQVRPELPPAFTLSDRDRRDFFAGKHDGDPKYLPGFIPPSLHIEGFGTLFFAEWVWVHPDEREEQHLGMLRLALGSGFGAEFDMCDIGSNGSGWPP